MSYIYMEHLFLMFLDRTQRRSTVGRTPLDEWSARRKDLYLTTHDTHNRHTTQTQKQTTPTHHPNNTHITHTLHTTRTLITHTHTKTHQIHIHSTNTPHTQQTHTHTTHPTHTHTHTHTHGLKYSLLFYCNNGSTNAPQCYVILTLLALARTLLSVTSYWHCLPCCCSCHSPTAIIFLYTVFQFVFLMDAGCVLCELQTEYLCLLQIIGIACLKVPGFRPLCLLIRKMKKLSIAMKASMSVKV